jgi:dihydroxy-acid dehydratase
MKYLNWNSKQVTQGWQKGIKAFYYGLNFEEEDFHKAQIGIGVPLLDGNPCNQHAYELAQSIKSSCDQAGLIGFPFGTPAVSDNITQGHEGGNASLPSRNMIANTAECVVSAHKYDALVGLHHCDKNGPGFAMALARLNFPGLIISGGSIKPGCHKGKDITILDAYDAQAAADAHQMETSEANEIISKACPGRGGCGIAASFNTWGIVLEAIGLMLPYSSSIPAEDSNKLKECQKIGSAIKILLEKNIRPRDILTKQAFKNAATVMAAIGGSTNGILHLLALAHEAAIPFTLKDMQVIFKSTPILCNFAPRGSKTMVDLHKIGGTPLILKLMLKHRMIDGDCLTVTGKTLTENLADIPDIPLDSGLITSPEKPFKDYADMQICFGNLAPEGIAFKVSSTKNNHFKGPAICFDSAKDVADAANRGDIQPGHVIVLRYLGPVASGMPEVLVASSALAVEYLHGKVALISDTRVSGVSHGVIGVHCSPEAMLGGPIALVHDGDEISFDLLEGSIHLHVDEAILQDRKSNWQAKDPISSRVFLNDFTMTTTQAHQGCVSQSVLRAT